MEASKKRKRESDCPRITYHAPGRTFDRLFRESSLADMQEVVRRKLSVQSTAAIRLIQLRDGQTVDLDDDDDFDAFQSVARTKSVIDVRVLVVNSEDQPAQPSTFAPSHLPTSRLPLRAQASTASMQSDQLPHTGSTDNMAASSNVSDVINSPQKKKRKRERSHKTTALQLETHPAPDPEPVSEPSLDQVHTFLSGSRNEGTEAPNTRQTEPPPAKKRKKKADAEEQPSLETINDSHASTSTSIHKPQPPAEPSGKKQKRARSQPPTAAPSHLQSIAESAQSNTRFARQLADIITTTGEANSKALSVKEQAGKKGIFLPSVLDSSNNLILVVKRKKAEKESSVEANSPSDVPGLNNVTKPATTTKKATETQVAKASADKPATRKRRNTISSVESSADTKNAVKATMVRLIAERRALVLGNQPKPPPAPSVPQVTRAASLPPTPDRNSTEPLPSTSSNQGTEREGKASSSSSLTAIATPSLSIAALPVNSRKFIAQLDLDAIIRGPVERRRVIDELSSSESEDERMSSLEDGNDSEVQKKPRRKTGRAVESSDDDANSNSEAEEAESSGVRQVLPELTTGRGDVMEVDEPDDDARSKDSTAMDDVAPLENPLDQPDNNVTIMSGASAPPDVVNNTEIGSSETHPNASQIVERPHSPAQIETQVEEYPVVPEAQEQPPPSSQRQLRSRSRKAPEASNSVETLQDGLSPLASKRTRKPTKKITEMEPPPLPTSTPITTRSRSKGRGVSTPNGSSQAPRKSTTADQTNTNSNTAKIPLSLASWTTLKQTSPNSSFTSAIDELHSSPAPTQMGGASNNTQVRTPPVTPLFLLSNSQTPFPYSQYNEPDDIESDREPLPALTPRSRSKTGFRSLTDIASQPSIFSTPATLRPATFPGAKNRHRRISDFYPPSLQDDVNDSDESSSVSGTEKESHIPRGRRAGAGR
ncbi:hypothetical protein BDN72DRAFT_893419 [Pluteus cervinus]|uniref:Uncharacterized protein n=1 Tax=Pluteus cervinus TaxID=181527 RepID=A0ACD3B8P2_9AGAR|nr:hypothetical protein BDN72DRAFT_893419 [Pluteus cervinus]